MKYIALFSLLFLTVVCCDKNEDTVQPQQGEVIITSQPSGAAIILNHSYTGKNTPDTLVLEPGFYYLELSLIGYQTVQDSFSLSANQELEFFYELEPDTTIRGNLFVSSYPESSSIFLDYQPTEYSTPDTILVHSGWHIIGVELPGYSSDQDSVYIESGQFHSLHFELKPEKKVLVEDFSNIDCHGCSEPDRFLHKIIGIYPNRVLGISYHIRFPNPMDPFYLANPEDNNTRKDFYEIGSAPQLFVDGSQLADATDSLLLHSTVEQHLELSSPMGIVTRGEVQGNSIHFQVKLYAHQTISATLYSVLVENEIHYEEPPGTNGTTDFYFIMREFELVDDIILHSGEKITYSDLSYTVGEPEDYSVIIFLQDYDTKQIIQSERITFE